MFNLTRFFFLFRFSYFRRPEMSCAWSAHFSHLSQPLGARCVCLCVYSILECPFFYFSKMKQNRQTYLRGIHNSREWLCLRIIHTFFSHPVPKEEVRRETITKRGSHPHTTILYLASDRIHRPHNTFVGWEGKRKRKNRIDNLSGGGHTPFRVVCDVKKGRHTKGGGGGVGGGGSSSSSRHGREERRRSGHVRKNVPPDRVRPGQEKKNHREVGGVIGRCRRA